MATRKSVASSQLNKKEPISSKKELDSQPEISIGMVGHVDHGKTTLVSALSGKWTDTHSEEIKRGITIKLGYADFNIFYCEKCSKYISEKLCPSCSSQAKSVRKVSLVDAPGHESLMAIMLSGAAIMDGAILLVAANEEFPQPQTREHFMALEIIGLHNIVICQNKIDLVTKEEAKKNYEAIKAFLKGTFAENAPIIPISAQQRINIDFLTEAMQEKIPTPNRDSSLEPIFLIARSFDINKPGADPEKISGGILGGALKQGTLKLNQIIEILPGMSLEKEGSKQYIPITTEIVSLISGGSPVNEIHLGGSMGIQTNLDPAFVKADSLSGNIAGLQGKMPPVWNELVIKAKLLERVVGAKEDVKVEPIKRGEPLMINVNSSVTVGVVTELSKGTAKLKLKKPVCCRKSDRLAISRMIGNRWRLIGTAEIFS